jgi:mono/diheme cytochrome c family protein
MGQCSLHEVGKVAQVFDTGIHLILQAYCTLQMSSRNLSRAFNGVAAMLRCLVLFFVASMALTAHCAESSPRPRDGRDARTLFHAACAGCHGDDGAGGARAELGFTPPATFPDFSDCSQATPEQDLAWRAMIRDGGPARGFSPIMPAFGDALDEAQIADLVRHLRSFCREPGWPRGELNVPRALLTEKAFPEDEVVLSIGTDAHRPRVLDGEFGYEHRIGRVAQLEIAVPFSSLPAGAGARETGVGDVAVGLKRVLHSHFDDASMLGSIFAVQGEVSLPTGSEKRGLGSGTTMFTVFGAYDQLLPRRMFLQIQGGVDVPTNSSKADTTAFLRSALGFSVSGHGAGRTWSPMIELAGERAVNGGSDGGTVWDVAPGLQITLSARQHVRMAVAWLKPLTQRTERDSRLLAYVLWDWADGGLLEGW